jgi:hypothetical protein
LRHIFVPGGQRLHAVNFNQRMVDAISKPHTFTCSHCYLYLLTLLLTVRVTSNRASAPCECEMNRMKFSLERGFTSHTGHEGVVSHPEAHRLQCCHVHTLQWSVLDSGGGPLTLISAMIPCAATQLCSLGFENAPIQYEAKRTKTHPWLTKCDRIDDVKKASKEATTCKEKSGNRPERWPLLPRL